MRRIIIRRSAFPLAVAVFGMGLGVAIGLVAGEWTAPALGRELRVPKRSRRDEYHQLASTVHRAQSALDDDLPLRDHQLVVRPAGLDRLELHGWVDTRPERARAGRLVAAVVDASIVNAIRVRGEDDDADSDADAGERTA